MQRIEVKFSEEEYLTMEKWIKEECTIIKEIEKEIFIKGEEEKVFLNLSEEISGRISLKIKSSKNYLINNEKGIALTSITLYEISGLIGVFSLSKKYLKEEILIRFTKEYEENGYYKSYKEYKQSKLKEIKRFVLKANTHNIFNCVKYFDFEDKEDLSLIIYSYINYIYIYEKEEEIEEFIKNKLEILGYERNPKLKDKLPIYEEKDKINLKSVSPKSLNYAFENLLEVFHKVINGNIRYYILVNGDIKEEMLRIEDYSCILTDYYVSNNNDYKPYT